MNIPLKIVDLDWSRWTEMQPGDCFRAPEHDKDGRECWVICVHREGDDPTLFPTTGGNDTNRLMWDVTGEMPNITVTPSIRIQLQTSDIWHGFITNGELINA